VSETVPKQRLKVRKLGLGETTLEGSYYPTIDGKAWGENGRAFWPTRAEAMRVGMRCFNKLLDHEKRESTSVTTILPRGTNTIRGIE
jgi:hypothetical protein